MGSRRVTLHHTTGWDGTRLHYELSGQPLGSGPVVVLNNGIGCAGYVWKYMRPMLERQCTVLHWHYRGHGHSGSAADSDNYSILDCVRDMDAVMDAADVDCGILFGHSMGVQVALEAALEFPNRTTGLVLLCGSHGNPLDTFQGTDRFRAYLPKLQQFVGDNQSLVKRLMELLVNTTAGWWVARGEVDGRLMKREDFEPYLEHLSKMDPVVFLRMLQSAAEHSTDDRLNGVAVPALVVGAEKDGFTPYSVSQKMADSLPKGELFSLRGGSHTAPLEQPQLLELALEDWLQRTGLWDDRPAV